MTPIQRAILRRIMRDEGLASESEAVRYLVERENRQRRGHEAALRLVRDLKRLERKWRGPKVNAAEDHDAFLGNLEH